jgi:trimeric autotransporter adhesin
MSLRSSSAARTSIRFAVLATLLPAVFLAGCTMETTAPEGNSFVSNATITGNAMGGQQPILGATVDLYSVGTSGYGSLGTHLATTITGSNGAFQFSQVTTQSGPSSTLNATYG